MRRLTAAAFAVVTVIVPAACGSTLSTPGPVTAPNLTPPATGTTIPSATPTSVTTAADCHTGRVSISAAQAATGSVTCIHVGATLSVDFDKSHGIGVAGPWTGAPTSDDPNVVALVDHTALGTVLHATFRAASPGATTVAAYWEVTCSEPQTTPCTIPPQGSIRLPVTVVP